MHGIDNVKLVHFSLGA